MGCLQSGSSEPESKPPPPAKKNNIQENPMRSHQENSAHSALPSSSAIPLQSVSNIDPQNSDPYQHQNNFNPNVQPPPRMMQQQQQQHNIPQYQQQIQAQTSLPPEPINHEAPKKKKKKKKKKKENRNVSVFNPDMSNNNQMQNMQQPIQQINNGFTVDDLNNHIQLSKGKTLQQLQKTNLPGWIGPIPTVLVMMRERLKFLGGFNKTGIFDINFILQYKNNDESYLQAYNIIQLLKNLPIPLMEPVPLSTIQKGTEAKEIPVVVDELLEPYKTTIVYLWDTLAKVSMEQGSKMTVDMLAEIFSKLCFAPAGSPGEEFLYTSLFRRGINWRIALRLGHNLGLPNGKPEKVSPSQYGQKKQNMFEQQSMMVTSNMNMNQHIPNQKVSAQMNQINEDDSETDDEGAVGINQLKEEVTQRDDNAWVDPENRHVNEDLNIDVDSFTAALRAKRQEKDISFLTRASTLKQQKLPDPPPTKPDIENDDDYGISGPGGGGGGMVQPPKRGQRPNSGAIRRKSQQKRRSKQFIPKKYALAAMEELETQKKKEPKSKPPIAPPPSNHPLQSIASGKQLIDKQLPPKPNQYQAPPMGYNPYQQQPNMYQQPMYGGPPPVNNMYQGQAQMNNGFKQNKPLPPNKKVPNNFKLQNYDDDDESSSEETNKNDDNDYGMVMQAPPQNFAMHAQKDMNKRSKQNAMNKRHSLVNTGNIDMGPSENEPRKSVFEESSSDGDTEAGFDAPMKAPPKNFIHNNAKGKRLTVDIGKNAGPNPNISAAVAGLGYSAQ